MKTLGIIKLQFNLFTTQVIIRITVFKTLAAADIARVTFGKHRVEAIKLIQLLVERDIKGCIPVFGNLLEGMGSQTPQMYVLTYPKNILELSSKVLVASNFFSAHSQTLATAQSA